MPAAKRLTAAAVFAGALFALPGPAAAQTGCELLYLQWEGCATECESYYENRVARAVCRAWCLVEYVHDYWTCESNVDASEGTESPPAEGDTGEPEEERGDSRLGQPGDRGGGRSSGAARGVVSRPPVGARRAVFRRALGTAPRCGAPSSSLISNAVASLPTPRRSPPPSRPAPAGGP